MKTLSELNERQKGILGTVIGAGIGIVAGAVFAVYVVLPWWLPMMAKWLSA